MAQSDSVFLGGNAAVDGSGGQSQSYYFEAIFPWAAIKAKQLYLNDMKSVERKSKCGILRFIGGRGAKRMGHARTEKKTKQNKVRHNFFF